MRVRCRVGGRRLLGADVHLELPQWRVRGARDVQVLGRVGGKGLQDRHHARQRQDTARGAHTKNEKKCEFTNDNKRPFKSLYK